MLTGMSTSADPYAKPEVRAAWAELDVITLTEAAALLGEGRSTVKQRLSRAPIKPPTLAYERDDWPTTALYPRVVISTWAEFRFRWEDVPAARRDSMAGLIVQFSAVVRPALLRVIADSLGVSLKAMRAYRDRADRTEFPSPLPLSSGAPSMVYSFAEVQRWHEVKWADPEFARRAPRAVLMPARRLAGAPVR